MIRKRSRNSERRAESDVDDLSRIKGIGPAIESRLHTAGILTLAQLGRASPNKIAAIITGLSAERIARENWINQARELARKKARRKTRKKEKAKPTIRQHYENFTIEFLLDEKNVVRRTRVLHVQSGDIDTWTNWEVEPLIEFLVRHTGIHSDATRIAFRKNGLLSEQALAKETTQPVTTMLSQSPGGFSADFETGLPRDIRVEYAPSSVRAVELAGEFHLRDLRVLSIGNDNTNYVLRQGRAYLVLLTLDLSGLVISNNVPLVYKATLFAKKVGGPCQLVIEHRAPLQSLESIALRLVGIDLPVGIYHLEASVTLAPLGMEPGHPQSLIAFLESGPFQVY